MDESEVSFNEKFSSYFCGSISFSSAFLALSLLFIESPLSDLSFGPVPALAILAIGVGIFLYLSKLGNDFLITPIGSNFVMAVALIGGVIAPFALLSSRAGLWLLPLIAAGIAAIIIIGSFFISTLTHFMLTLITSVAFVLAGLIGILFSQQSSKVTLGAACILMLFAWICAFSLKEKEPNLCTAVSSAESRERDTSNKANRCTFFMIGLAFGASSGIIIALQSHYFTDALTVSMAVGLPTMIAGVVTMVLRHRYEYRLEKLSKKFFTSTIMIGMLPIPFLQPTGQLICAGFLLFVSVIQVIIATDAVAENIRFGMISPIWYLGEEAIIAIGSSVGLLISWWGFLDPGQSIEVPIACYTVIFISSVFQVFMDARTYPTAEMYDFAGIASRNSEDAALKGGAFWHAKLDVIAHEYGLSPRQTEIMLLLAKGRDVKYIVDDFSISRSTAKTHIYNLYKKLGIHSRQDLLDMLDQIHL